MKHRLTAAFIFLTISLPALAVEISEDIYAGTDHFVIKTKKVTYYLDKEGGGLSRMIDKQGNDWISFKKDPWNNYPESAASSYRGLPNLVFRSEDSGAGHPGHKKCYSFVVDKNTILTISKSGKWQWRWKFFKNYATITMEKVDHDHKYWFLYEGPIAGEFKPEFQYWGTNLGGPRREETASPQSVSAVHDLDAAAGSQPQAWLLGTQDHVNRSETLRGHRHRRRQPRPARG